MLIAQAIQYIFSTLLALINTIQRSVTDTPITTENSWVEKCQCVCSMRPVINPGMLK